MLRRASLIVFAACLLAGPALAELPEPVRHGPACPPAGCSSRNGSPLGLAAGFGIATLAILRHRRRDQQPG